MFLQEKLHTEIEKISLFSLTRLGELANAIGVLRFTSIEYGNIISSDYSDDTSGGISYQEPHDEECGEEPTNLNYNEIGEKCECFVFRFISYPMSARYNVIAATLLPSSDKRSVKSPSRKSISRRQATRLFSKKALTALIGREPKDAHDKINVYSELGVELLHILKYTCINAAGIRKISKKYAKLINFFPVTSQADKVQAAEGNDLLMPKELAQSYETIVDLRIDQLTNNKDFATVSNEYIPKLTNIFLNFTLCTRFDLMLDIRITS